MEKFLIIDGNSLINRAFYALPLLTNDKGEFSNAVYGFCSMLIKAIIENKPTHIAVAFDFGKKTFRNSLYNEYKANRKSTPTELKNQFPIMKKVLQTMGIKYIEKEGIEADDIIGCLSKSTDVETIILSGDRDLFQLVDDTTSVWFTKKGISDVEMITCDNIIGLTGLSASQVIDYKAIRGDTADNIPGISGIGEKGAKTLLEKYSTLDNVYLNIESINGSIKDKLLAGKDMAYLSKTLATIKDDINLNVSLNDFEYKFPFDKKTYDVFSEYNFKSLLKRQDIFESELNISLEEDIPCELVMVEKLDELRKILSYVNDDKVFAVKLEKDISFAFSPNYLYKIKNDITFFDELTTEIVLQEIKPLLQDEKITKIVFDVKNIQHILNYKLAGQVFDIAIAKYVVADNIDSSLPCNLYFKTKSELLNKMKMMNVDNLYKNIEMPLINVLFDMENNGFKINEKKLEDISLKLELEKEEEINNIFSLAGEKFNINSPQQLAVILYDKLNINLYNNKKRSTAIEILEEIRDKHSIVEHILTYRKCQKMISTYINPYKELVKKQGTVIHTVFNQFLTSTGRLSSSEPNLQNIPVRTDDGRKLREMFVSRYENGKIVSADYNQIELRLLANFSNDETLVSAYEKNEDIHTLTASKIFNIPKEMVSSEQRRMAKAVNFGIIYGISDYGLSQNLGITRQQAKDYIEMYFQKYPKVKLYMNDNVESAKENGYSITYFGRIRKVPSISSGNYNDKTAGMRIAMNMPLQGAASDILKLAMIEVDKAIKSYNLKSKLILTIHDELIVDSTCEEEDIVKAILKECMENVIEFKVPLTVNITSGQTWADCK